MWWPILKKCKLREGSRDEARLVVRVSSVDKIETVGSSTTSSIWGSNVLELGAIE